MARNQFLVLIFLLFHLTLLLHVFLFIAFWRDQTWRRNDVFGLSFGLTLLVYSCSFCYRYQLKIYFMVRLWQYFSHFIQIILIESYCMRGDVLFVVYDPWTNQRRFDNLKKAVLDLFNNTDGAFSLMLDLLAKSDFQTLEMKLSHATVTKKLLLSDLLNFSFAYTIFKIRINSIEYFLFMFRHVRLRLFNLFIYTMKTWAFFLLLPFYNWSWWIIINQLRWLSFWQFQLIFEWWTGIMGNWRDVWHAWMMNELFRRNWRNLIFLVVRCKFVEWVLEYLARVSILRSRKGHPKTRVFIGLLLMRESLYKINIVSILLIMLRAHLDHSWFIKCLNVLVTIWAYFRLSVDFKYFQMIVLKFWKSIQFGDVAGKPIDQCTHFNIFLLFFYLGSDLLQG